MNTASVTTAELARLLGRSMLEMRNRISFSIQEKIRDHGLSMSVEMLEIMACLWKKDGINQQEIAALTIKDKSSITHLINQLVKHSLVKRVADTSDRRNRLIYLTKDGRQLEKKFNPWIIDIYDTAVEGIDRLEIESSLLLIENMNQNLRLLNVL